MSENTQLIQEAVDEIMESGPKNLASFLEQWDSSSLTKTPTSKESMTLELANLAGQVDTYLTSGDGSLASKIAGYLDAEGTAMSASFASSIGALGAKMGIDRGGHSSSYKFLYDFWRYIIVIRCYRILMEDHPAILRVKLTLQHLPLAKGCRRKSEKKRTMLKPPKVKADALAASRFEAVDPAKGAVSNMLYAEGGLVDYTGPAIVHGSKSKPEVVLNPRQTSIFQNFTELLDKAFGQNMRAGMVQSYTSPSQNNENGPTVVVENITLTSGVIAKDYDARRAGDLVKEEILKIAKYQGGMSIGRK